jgi:hypothetical protein
MAFTADVALQLAGYERRSGAYTPGVLFRPSLAADAGGQFFMDAGPEPQPVLQDVALPGRSGNNPGRVSDDKIAEDR